jgi:hypothetical protein
LILEEDLEKQAILIPADVNDREMAVAVYESRMTSV